MTIKRERRQNVGAIEVEGSILQGIVELAADGQITLTITDTDALQKVVIALPDPVNVKVEDADGDELEISPEGNAHVEIFDGAIGPVQVDDLTNRLAILESTHCEIHESNHYFFHDTATVASAGIKYYLFTTPDSAVRAHFLYTVDFTAVTTVEFFEASDRVGTNAQIEYNNDRNSGNAPDLTIHEAISGGSTDGTLLQPFKGGLATGASAKAGGVSRNDDELILKQNTKYLLKITSGTNGNEISTKVAWYEE